MKIINTLLLLAFVYTLSAQTTATFESYALEQDSVLNGADGSGGFDAGNIHLVNNYDDMWGSWSGWAISAATDNITPGFLNQYSSITGAGVNGSSTYATAFIASESLMYTTNDAQGGTMEGFYINNATYSYLSMQDGDAFSKKFGGEDGNDPDFLYVTIKEYGARNIANDSINIYLADFTDSNNANDYILDEWTYVDLTRFENVDTLSFTIHSSDVGLFGINTPKYFCIDDVTTTDMALTSTSQLDTNPTLMLYPNPATENLTIIGSGTTYTITGLDGQRRMSGSLSPNINTNINIKELNSGMYLVSCSDNKGQTSIEKLIIE